MTQSSSDTWSQWLLHRRFGGDEAQLRAAMAFLAPVRERVLQNARLTVPEPEHRFGGYDVTLVHELATRVKAVYRRRQPLDTDPMLDFDERDLLAFAEGAGFTTINLELQAQVAPPQEPVRCGDAAGGQTFGSRLPLGLQGDASRSVSSGVCLKEQRDA